MLLKDNINRLIIIPVVYLNCCMVPMINWSLDDVLRKVKLDLRWLNKILFPQ